MSQARSDYKSIIRKCKYEHDLQITYKLEKARSKNAKTYWNMLKKNCKYTNLEYTHR